MLIPLASRHSGIRKHVLQEEPAPLPTGHSGESLKNVDCHVKETISSNCKPCSLPSDGMFKLSFRHDELSSLIVHQIASETLEKEEPEFCSKINPRAPFTSMMVAHNCRLIMGPGRQGDVYGIVAMVPDGKQEIMPLLMYHH